MLTNVLPSVFDPDGPPDWRRLGEHLPCEWIGQALVQTGKASIRHRRLPAEQVVWLVIALALCRHQSIISEVVDDLNLALPDVAASFVSKSAVAQAREWLGSDPLEWLFHTSAQAWSAQGYAGGTVASYPQVRGVTVTSIPTHLVVDAAFGPYEINEMRYAKTLVPAIANASLTVFDRGFLSAEILCGLTAGGEHRHFLIPAKCNTKWQRIDGDADDGLVAMRVSPQARKKSPDLPEFWCARAIAVIDPQGRRKVLLTSLTDRKRFKAADIVACYSRRWQIETRYREWK